MTLFLSIFIPIMYVVCGLAFAGMALGKKRAHRNYGGWAPDTRCSSLGGGWGCQPFHTTWFGIIWPVPCLIAFLGYLPFKFAYWLVNDIAKVVEARHSE